MSDEINLPEEENNQTIQESEEDSTQQTQPVSESEELIKLRDALSRAQADYQNLLRRMERDREEMMWFITSGVIKKFLPHIDNLERAIATKQGDESDAWVNGVRSTIGGIEKTLADMNVKTFDSIGEEVNADKHEVMSQTTGEAGKIVFEFEKGYMLNDKVLRHAKVVTGNGEANVI